MAGWNKVLYEVDSTASVQFDTLSVGSATISGGFTASSATITSATFVSATVSSLVAVSAAVDSFSVNSTLDLNESTLADFVIETVSAVSDLPAAPTAARVLGVSSTEHLYVYF